MAMMESADTSQSYDLSLRRWSMLSGSAIRCILQLSVDAIGVVVVNVFAEKASKVVLVRDDHVIE